MKSLRLENLLFLFFGEAGGRVLIFCSGFWALGSGACGLAYPGFGVVFRIVIFGFYFKITRFSCGFC